MSKIVDLLLRIYEINKDLKRKSRERIKCVYKLSAKL